MTTPILHATESSTLTLNGRVLLDALVGDYFVLAPVNPYSSRVNGAGNAVVIAKRSDSNVHTLTINLIKNSADHVWFNNLLNADYPPVFTGSLKENYKFGDEERVSTWLLEGGSVTDQPTDTRNNQENNATITYVIEFRNAVESN